MEYLKEQGENTEVLWEKICDIACKVASLV